MVLFWTEPILIFLVFMKEMLVKKKGSHDYFDKQEKPWIVFKIFQKKKIKAIRAVLDYLKPKIFFINQPWWSTFFQTLSPNYFSAAMALYL